MFDPTWPTINYKNLDPTRPDPRSVEISVNDQLTVTDVVVYIINHMTVDYDTVVTVATELCYFRCRALLGRGGRLLYVEHLLRNRRNINRATFNHRLKKRGSHVICCQN